jgi:hypothetical protein
MTPEIVAQPGCAAIRLLRIAEAKPRLSAGLPVPLAVATMGERVEVVGCVMGSLQKG